VRYTITDESDGERILKIGQHLPKLWARIKWVFFPNTVYVRGIIGLKGEIKYKIVLQLNN